MTLGVADPFASHWMAFRWFSEVCNSPYTFHVAYVGSASTDTACAVCSRTCFPRNSHLQFIRQNLCIRWVTVTTKLSEGHHHQMGAEAGAGASSPWCAFSIYSGWFDSWKCSWLFLLKYGFIRLFLLKFINKNTRLCVRPFNYIENLFIAIESVMWQVVNSL